MVTAIASLTVASDEWYRSSDWDDRAREAFEVQLGRARDYNRPQYLKIKALTLLESGAAADGVDLLRRVLHEYPDSLDAAYCAERLGDHYLVTNHPAAAAKYYRHSLALRPDQNATTGEVHIGLAEALTAQERYDEALNALDLVPVTRLTLNHSVCRWNVALAVAALGAGNVHVARDAAARALALLQAPDQFSRHSGVGRAVLSDAQRTWLQAIEEGDAPRRETRRWSLRRRSCR